MMRSKTFALLTVAVAASAGLAACGSDDSSTSAGSTSSSSSSSPMMTSSSSSSMMSDAQFGSACSQIPTSGSGSLTGMAADPVATAASNNPLLSTLVKAVQAAGLVDTLNSAQGITVFAPVNDAFAKVPSADLTALLANKAMLTKVLTYHVVGQTVTPADLASGSFTSLEGGKVTTSGTGQDYKVGDANVICGNIKTANATVYLIDSVLTPPAS